MNDSVSQIQCLLEKKLSEEELVNGTASSMINKSSLIPDLNEDIMQVRVFLIYYMCCNGIKIFDKLMLCFI